MSEQIECMKRFVERICGTRPSPDEQPIVWTGERVLSWMCGIGLPPVGRSDQAYVWFWRGIKAAADAATISRTFAQLLQTASPDINRQLFPDAAAFLAKIELYTGEAAANLWGLMRLLDQPDLLGPVVRETVQLLPSASWLQVREMKSIRERLLLVLPSAAIESILAGSDTNRDTLETFAEAIGFFTESDYTIERRQKLVKWLAAAKDKWAGHVKELKPTMIKLSDDLAWPPWATSALPDVFSKELTGNECFVWSPVFEPFRESIIASGAHEKRLCGDEVVHLRNADPDKIELMGKISSATDELRKKNPFPGMAAKREIVRHAIYTCKDLAVKAQLVALPTY